MAIRPALRRGAATALAFAVVALGCWALARGPGQRWLPGSAPVILLAALHPLVLAALAAFAGLLAGVVARWTERRGAAFTLTAVVVVMVAVAAQALYAPAVASGGVEAGYERLSAALCGGLLSNIFLGVALGAALAFALPITVSRAGGLGDQGLRGLSVGAAAACVFGLLSLGVARALDAYALRGDPGPMFVAALVGTAALGAAFAAMPLGVVLPLTRAALERDA
jgi:hypothetical protein